MSDYDWKFWLYRDELDGLILGAFIGLLIFILSAALIVVL